MIDDVFRQRVTLFILDFLIMPERGIDSRGFATDEAIVAAMEVLMEEEMFKTVGSLRFHAVKRRGVIIPHRYFEGVTASVQ